jgi:hypothetical protein
VLSNGEAARGKELPKQPRSRLDALALPSKDANAAGLSARTDAGLGISASQRLRRSRNGLPGTVRFFGHGISRSR